MSFLVLLLVVLLGFFAGPFLSPGEAKIDEVKIAKGEGRLRSRQTSSPTKKRNNATKPMEMCR